MHFRSQLFMLLLRQAGIIWIWEEAESVRSPGKRLRGSGRATKATPSLSLYQLPVNALTSFVQFLYASTVLCLCLLLFSLRNEKKNFSHSVLWQCYQPKELLLYFFLVWWIKHFLSLLTLFSRSIFYPNRAPTTASTNQQSPTCGWTPCRFGRWSAPTCRCRQSTRLPWDWSVSHVISPSMCFLW